MKLLENEIVTEQYKWNIIVCYQCSVFSLARVSICHLRDQGMEFKKYTVTNVLYKRWGLKLGSQFERMDGIKSLSRQCLFTLLILNFIISQTISLNHNREQRDVLDSKLEIPITEVEASNSSDSIVIKAVDIPEELVTYEGSQVWRVVEGTEEKKQYVSYLQEIGGLKFIFYI